MTASIYAWIPDSEDLLALEPEELAGVVLEHLNALSEEGFNSTGIIIFSTIRSQIIRPSRPNPNKPGTRGNKGSWGAET